MLFRLDILQLQQLSLSCKSISVLILCLPIMRAHFIDGWAANFLENKMKGREERTKKEPNFQNIVSRFQQTPNVLIGQRLGLAGKDGFAQQKENQFCKTTSCLVSQCRRKNLMSFITGNDIFPVMPCPFGYSLKGRLLISFVPVPCPDQSSHR